MNLIATVLLFLHSYYVGLTEIEYDRKEQTYQIGIRVFTDDLETTLKKKSGEFIDIMSSDVLQNTDIIMVGYILENFELSSDQGRIPINHIGSEIEAEVTWIFFETEKMEKASILRVKNKIFFESFDDQTHIVNYQEDGDVESRLLHKDGFIAEFKD
ncbi:MAG: DUF6702 family protein [Bacteroidota bacterium]